MATVSRQVKFEGIDLVLESQKTERGHRDRKARRERKKAQKMEVLDAKEDLRYFVLFLQTYQIENPQYPDRPSLRQMIQSSGFPILRLLFPGAADDATRMQQFEEFVTNRQLPTEGKSRLKAQIGHLTTMMQVCQIERTYTDLDRFLQELRHSDQLGTLDDYFDGLCPTNGAIFRQLLDAFRRHGIGLTRASCMTPADRDGLRAFMDAHNEATRPNRNTLSSVSSSSSDESSDDDIRELRRFD